jgi:flagellar hook-basal body complex protein FliE
MNIPMIAAGLPTATLFAPQSLESEAATGSGSFGSMVFSAVNAIEQSQKGAEEEIARAVTGASPDIHRTAIALQTADLQFQLGLQVRNKVVNAFEEIMRMQV